MHAPSPPYRACCRALVAWSIVSLPLMARAAPDDPAVAAPPAVSADPAPDAAALPGPAAGVPGGPDGLPGTALWIRVGPSARVQYPLAVADTECVGAPEALCKSLGAILRRNLELTALFQLLDPKSFIADPKLDALDEPRWPDWFNVGAKYLIKTRLEGQPPAMTVDFRLHSVLEKKAFALSGQRAVGIANAEQLREATYPFCNEVMRTITGKPGIFGTRILFAAKTGRESKGIGALVVGAEKPRGVIGGGGINMLPAFAPGGVMYTSFRDGKPAIFIGQTKITNDNNEYRGARFSPDGSTIAVSVEAGGNAEIYLMSPSGGLQQNLTNNWAADVSPVWSPDGSQIAFVSDRAGGPQVYVTSRGGGGARRVTMAGGYNSTPDWGANGLIAFAGMTPEGKSDIFTVGAEGGMERLTQDQGSNRDPAWSPEGQYVAFVSTRDGGARLWIMTADGRYQYPLSERAGGYSTLRWGK